MIAQLVEYLKFSPKEKRDTGHQRHMKLEVITPNLSGFAAIGSLDQGLVMLVLVRIDVYPFVIRLASPCATISSAGTYV